MQANTKKLAAYSIASLSYLALQTHGKAQVIYTDIDPDIDIDIAHESAGVDMDNDGVFDFGFIKSTGTAYSYGAGYIKERGLWCGPQIEGNALLGILHTADNDGYYPYALELGYTVNAYKPFFSYGSQQIANKQILFSAIYIGLGYWYPEQHNHYLGVRFQDIMGLDYYGWIRCDVKHNGQELIIKDYAYQATPGKGIVAGDKTGDALEIPNVENDFNPIIYSFNNTIVINLPFINNAALIHIYNTTGQEVYATTTKNNHTTIPLNVAAGIYLVEVISGENRVSKKVVVN